MGVVWRHGTYAVADIAEQCRSELRLLQSSEEQLGGNSMQQLVSLHSGLICFLFFFLFFLLFLIYKEIWSKRRLIFFLFVRCVLGHLLRHFVFVHIFGQTFCIWFFYFISHTISVKKKIWLSLRSLPQVFLHMWIYWVFFSVLMSVSAAVSMLSMCVLFTGWSFQVVYAAVYGTE